MGSSASRELLSKVQLESGDGASTSKALPLSINVARQVFALFDKNRDGKLDRSESVKFISAYLVAHGEPKATPERALALLAAIDRNGDGNISFEELTGVPLALGFAMMPRVRLGQHACGAFTGVALLAKIEIVQLLEHDWKRRCAREASPRPLHQHQHPAFVLRLVCREFKALVDNLITDGLVCPPFSVVDVSAVREHNFCKSALPLTAQELRRTCHKEKWFGVVDAYISEMSSRSMTSLACEYHNHVVLFTDANIKDDDRLKLQWIVDGRPGSKETMSLGSRQFLPMKIDVFRDAAPSTFQFLTSEPMQVFTVPFGAMPEIRELRFDAHVSVAFTYAGIPVGQVSFEPVCVGAIRSELKGDKNTLTVLFTELEATASKRAPEFLGARSAVLINGIRYALR